MRDHGRRWAQRRGARWLLQLDADEVLVNGELLRPLLERWPFAAYPIPLVQENGQTTLAPFKCLQLPARIVACSEYVQFGRAGRTPRSHARIWNLAGYSCPPELRTALLELPFLLHTPSRRGPGIRAGARLSFEELAVERRPANAVQWPLPPLTLRFRSAEVKTQADGTVFEYEASDGDYACPGCGARFDTPGICTGSDEAPHEPIPVEAVGAGSGEGPSKAELEDRARELGIEGRSSMSKDELAAAIAEHEQKVNADA